VTSEAPYVLVVQDGRIAKKNVTLGIRGEGSIEIASGLEDGPEIVVQDGTVLAVGQRVRSSLEAR